MTRAAATIVVGALLCAYAGACGRTAGPGALPQVRARSQMPRGPDMADGDADSAGKRRDADDSNLLRYGHAADSAERAVVVALLRRYYAAAAAGDGAQGCRLVVGYPLVAETAWEQFKQHTRALPKLDRAGCAAVLSKLFRLRHAQLARCAASMRVTVVRLSHNSGAALMRVGLGPSHERQTLLRPVHGTWRIAGVYDEGLP